MGLQCIWLHGATARALCGEAMLLAQHVLLGSPGCVAKLTVNAVCNLCCAALTGLLTHAAATGFLVAIASSDRFAAHTTWLLQKSVDGNISNLSKLLFWPYHLGLRGKLYIQASSVNSHGRVQHPVECALAKFCDASNMPAGHLATISSPKSAQHATGLAVEQLAACQHHPIICQHHLRVLCWCVLFATTCSAGSQLSRSTTSCKAQGCI